MAARRTRREPLRPRGAPDPPRLPDELAPADLDDIADCELSGSDWYGAHVRRSRILRSTLDGSELSTATFEDVALHGSSLAGVRGADLRDVVIGSDQVIEVAVAVFATRGIVIDDAAADDALDEPGGSST